MLQHFQYIIIIYFSLLGLIIFPAFHKTRLPLYSIPLFAAAFIGAILFFFALFNQAKIGVYLILFINIVLLLVTLFDLLRHAVKKKARACCCESLKEPLIFLVIFSVCFFAIGLLSKLWFYHVGWDEWSFWDEYVRSLMRYGGKDFLTVHPAYPIGISLFQYYFCVFCVQNEHLVYFATVYLLFAVICYIYSVFRTKVHTVLFPLIALLIISLLYIFDFEIFSLFIDGLLGVFFGAFLLSVFTEKEYGLAWCLYQALFLMFFIQMKDTCLVLTLGVLILAAFCRIIDAWQREISLSQAVKSFFHWPQLRNFLLLALLPLSTSLIWKVRNEVMQITDKLDYSQINLPNILGMFSPEGTDWQRTTYTNIVNQIFNEPYTNTGVTAWVFVLFLVSLILLVWLANRDQKYLIINTFLFLGLILFNLLQNLHYLFSMEKWAADELNSYERYLAPFLLGWVIFICFYILSKAFGKEAQPVTARRVFTALSFMLVGLSFIKTPMDKVFSMPPRQDENWQRTLSFFNDYGEFVEPGSTMKMLSPEFWYPHYYQLWNIFVGQSHIIMFYDEELILEFDAVRMAEYLEEKDVDYLCIWDVHQDFWDKYASLVDKPTIDSQNYALYRRVEPGKYELVER